MSHEHTTLQLSEGSPDGWKIDFIPYSFKHLVCARECHNFVNHVIEVDIADADYRADHHPSLPRDRTDLPNGPYAPSISDLATGFKVGEIPHLFANRTNARMVADFIAHITDQDTNDPGFKGIRSKGLWLEHGPAWADFT